MRKHSKNMMELSWAKFRLVQNVNGLLNLLEYNLLMSNHIIYSAFQS